jgi:hypothetical protein
MALSVAAGTEECTSRVGGRRCIFLIVGSIFIAAGVVSARVVVVLGALLSAGGTALFGLWLARATGRMV